MRRSNQSEIICNGIAEIINRPVIKITIRKVFTETQTKKHSLERCKNVACIFCLINFAQLKGTHILLVSDAITTSATLEGCGSEILKIKDVKL